MRWIFNSQLQYTFTQHCHQLLQARNFLWSPSLFLDIDFRKLNMQTSHIMEMNIAFVGLFQNQNQLCFPLPNFYSDFITLIQDYKKAPTNNKTWTREWVLLGHTSKGNLELLAVNLWSSQWQWKKVTSRQGNRWLDEGDESQGPQGLTVGVLGERINKPWSRLVLICNHPPLLWTRSTDCAEWRGPKYGGGGGQTDGPWISTLLQMITSMFMKKIFLLLIPIFELITVLKS